MDYKTGFGRIFGRSVLLIAILLNQAGCGSKGDHDQPDPAQVESAKTEVTAKWMTSENLGQELKQKFQISILDAPYRTQTGQSVNSKLMGQKYNWGRLSLTDRRAAKDKLTQYEAALRRVVYVATNLNGYFLTDMDKVRSRLAGAVAFSASLRQFETALGQNYDPKTPGQPPIYYSPIDI